MDGFTVAVEDTSESMAGIADGRVVGGLGTATAAVDVSGEAEILALEVVAVVHSVGQRLDIIEILDEVRVGACTVAVERHLSYIAEAGADCHVTHRHGEAIFAVVRTSDDVVAAVVVIHFINHFAGVRFNGQRDSLATLGTTLIACHRATVRRLDADGIRLTSLKHPYREVEIPGGSVLSYCCRRTRGLQNQTLSTTHGIAISTSIIKTS